MTIPKITAAEARDLIAKGASLIDIREADEHRRERIAGAVNIPLSDLTAGSAKGAKLIFHCRSGLRTGMAADQLRNAAAGRDCYVLHGGIDGWRGAGFATGADVRAPIEIQRQVMIAAGLVILTAALLSLFLAPAFVWLVLAVGAGLLVAGISGFCAMARLLALAPWNRATLNG